jgi:Resolvase, N terminal domain
MKSKVLTKAVSYLRCTGLGQVDGDTWDRQTAAIAKYAKTHGLQLVDEFRDAGISGTKDLDNRPGLAALLDRIEKEHSVLNPTSPTDLGSLYREGWVEGHAPHLQASSHHLVDSALGHGGCRTPTDHRPCQAGDPDDLPAHITKSGSGGQVSAGDEAGGRMRGASVRLRLYRSKTVEDSAVLPQLPVRPKCLNGDDILTSRKNPQAVACNCSHDRIVFSGRIFHRARVTCR